MSALAALLFCVAALLALAVLAVALSRTKLATPLVYGATLLIATTIAIIAAMALTGGATAPTGLTLPLGLPWIGARFRLDALAAFFLVVIGLGAAITSLYALGYGRHETSPHRVLPFLPAFIAGMSLVVLADDAFSFLISWEFMSLASWALVMAHHHDADNTRAGYIYLVMASFGTLALLLAFGLISGPEGNYTFDAIRAAPHSPTSMALTLALMLIGAGSKAGLAPLHVWLPLAHPAAPSHVSALMSGIMTKVAVYGFVRVVFDLLGPAQWWMSAPVLLLGGLTAVLGILHALMETDLKRVLAYSTIENIGVVFVSLGLALAFQANGIGWAAALAFTAALFHVLNHSLFKSLLFFGAGAVLTATGERDMERLGGLIHAMPRTSLTFLVGCVAISALPPFNGFVSEWLMFQTILQSPNLPQWGLKILVPAIGGLLALAAALAAACFVRAFGITFLGRPRSVAAQTAREVDRFMIAAMVVLALLCLGAGIVPGLVIDAISPAARMVLHAVMPEQASVPWLSIIPISEGRSSYNGLLVFAFIALSASLSAYVIHRVASRALRRGPAWGCGFAATGAATQYSASGFAQPIRRVFGPMVLRARIRVKMPPPGDTAPARFDLELHDRVWNALYEPIAGAIGAATESLNQLQFLTIRRYLSLVFMSLIALLLVLALWS
ncbi:MAG: hydrogenase 4 subunit B [Xanthobacteraceae bacterium]|nr:MAG: hydrogenase 4 subunit B [Xanthobacteraceae bacterium]